MKKNQKCITMSPNDAFDFFTELTQTPEMAYDFIRQGCQHRTHLTCKKLSEFNYESKKAWAVSKLQSRVNMKLASNQTTDWSYHVAAATPILIHNKKIDFVFDPSLFDGPISFKEWLTYINTDEIFTTLVNVKHSNDITPWSSATDFSDQVAELELNKLKKQLSKTTIKRQVHPANFKRFL